MSEQASVGDLQIAYRVWGRGEPLLLITGFGATMDIWDPELVNELAAHYRVIAFDNRGLGGTTAPDADYSIEQLADDTAGLMGALGLERAHVLGYSMGGYVAQELALAHPERVTRLVLMGTGSGGSEGIAPRAEVLQALSDMSGSIDEVLGRVISVLVPDDWSSSHGAYLRDILLRPPAPPSAESLARQRQAMDTWQGTCERLSQVRTPTLVLTGTADQVLAPANAMLLVSRIPGACLVGAVPRRRPWDAVPVPEADRRRYPRLPAGALRVTFNTCCEPQAHSRYVGFLRSSEGVLRHGLSHLTGPRRRVPRGAATPPGPWPRRDSAHRCPAPGRG
jgi:pimeloyl-ACP methyl ester carboxylesterase